MVIFEIILRVSLILITIVECSEDQGIINHQQNNYIRHSGNLEFMEEQMKQLQTDNVDLKEKIRDMDYRFDIYDNQIDKYRLELNNKQN